MGPSIDTTDPSHSKFQVWCSCVVWFWSYSLPKVSPNISKIGQLYVLSDSIPCLFSKVTVVKICISDVYMLHGSQNRAVCLKTSVLSSLNMMLKFLEADKTALSLDCHIV